MGNFKYGSSFDDFYEVFSYDAEPILDLLSKYYNNDIVDEEIRCNGMYSKVDSLLLYAMVRERGFKNILEIGGGCTTNIMLKALQKNGKESVLTNYSEKLQSSLVQLPDNVKMNFFEGNLLETFEESDFNVKDVDFCFIDGAHHAYFAMYYFYEILQKLSVGAIIHIHDIQNPEVLKKAYDFGFIPLHPLYCPEPTPTCEIYAMYLFFKQKQYGARYKVLCNTNDLLYSNLERLNYISEVKRGMYEHPAPTAPAESLWLEVIK